MEKFGYLVVKNSQRVSISGVYPSKTRALKEAERLARISLPKIRAYERKRCPWDKRRILLQRCKSPLSVGGFGIFTCYGREKLTHQTFEVQRVPLYLD